MSVVCTIYQYVSCVLSSSESCMFRNVVYILCDLCVFKMTKFSLLLTSDVVQVAPLSKNSMLKFLCFADTCIENHFKWEMYILISNFGVCFVLFLRHVDTYFELHVKVGTA
jgi:hypothetical protein